MRRTWMFGLLVLAAAACSKEEPAAEPAPAEEPPPAAEPAAPEPVAFDARTTFNTVCATCHGIEGKGDGAAAAALNPKPAAFGSSEFWADGKDKAHIMKVIKEGGAAVGKSPLMAAYGGQYTDEQISELADIVMGFKPAE